MSTIFPKQPATGGRRPAGFSMVTAIFLLVILALLGAFLVRVASIQHTSSTLDVQSTRAYQAARAGVEWGAYQVLDPANTSGSALQACPASPTALTLAGTLSEFNVSVTCSRTTHTEANRDIGVYLVTARASSGAVGSPFYVERELTVTLSKCKDATAPAPYACG